MSIEPQPGPGPSRPAGRVDPHLVFGISLFIALAVSWPALSGAMHGNVDIIQAGAHLLVAVALSWTGCYGIGTLLHGYAHGAGTPVARTAAAELTRRRATDALDAPLPAGIDADGDVTTQADAA